MSSILNNKLVLLQTHYWLAHSHTPFALAIFYIAFYLSLFLEITNIFDRMQNYILTYIAIVLYS